MNLFLQILRLQLLIFCMAEQEFVANLDLIMLFYVFFCNSIKVNNFFVSFIILLHLTSLFSLTRSCSFHMHVFTESIDCILLSSFELTAILLISSVKTLQLSLLSLCCVFYINLLFLMSSL